jgi:peroxiredoxin Q/BCP
MNAVRYFLASMAIFAGFCVGSLRADDATLKVKEGDAFPDFKLPATQAELVKKGAKEISLADLKGKIVVVAFYPKALTGGCTIECNSFRDLQKGFPADTVILGASADKVELNQEFTDKNKYTFPLLCDSNLTLIKELGILSSPTGKASKRVTFIISKDGKIAKIYTAVTPKTHVEEVQKFVKELAAK